MKNLLSLHRFAYSGYLITVKIFKLIPYKQNYVFSWDRMFVANSRIYQFLTQNPAFKFQGDEIKEAVFKKKKKKTAKPQTG